MQEWFKDWFDSPYYHILYKNRSHEEANDFVENIIKHFNLNEHYTLLDVACGKGRHSIAFAAKGLDVTGIDLSKNSIAHALQFAHDTLQFYVHDMRHIFRANYFDIVCNLFTSFGYFKSTHDNQLAVKSMYQSVKKNGIVLIDFVNKNFAIRSIEANTHEDMFIDNINFKVLRTYTEHRLSKQITIQDQDKKFQFEESINSFSLHEMTDLFTSVGFTLKDIFGNYQFETYDEESSPRMILIFTK